MVGPRLECERARGALNDVARTILATTDDIYVGGSFTNVAGIATADYVARWTTAAWTAVDNGTSGMLLGTFVYALGFKTTASGYELYIGGNFTNQGGVATADRIARWNGTAWSGLGSNGAGDGAIANGFVEAIAIHAGDIYIGGGFTNAAGIAEADFVARYDGSWHALGSNGAGNGAIGYEVMSLLANGSDLYVGGGYINAAGIPEAHSLAMWNGTSWSALGSSANGLDGGFGPSTQILDMLVLNDRGRPPARPSARRGRAHRPPWSRSRRRERNPEPRQEVSVGVETCARGDRRRRRPWWRA